jgi:hypothetical protein
LKVEEKSFEIKNPMSTKMPHPAWKRSKHSSGGGGGNRSNRSNRSHPQHQNGQNGHSEMNGFQHMPGPK